MAPYFKPLDTASEVTFERYYLAANFTSGVGYGAQAVLYLICTHYLWGQRKARRNNKFMLAYITLLFLISTVVQVAWAHRTQLVFIEHRDFPGGPWAYYKVSDGEAPGIVSRSAGMVLMFLSDILMVWRCWVVWYSVSRRAAYAVAFLPALILAALLATFVPCSLMIHPNTPFAGAHTTAWVISWYTLMLSVNVLATGFILTRLIMHRLAMRTIASPHAGEFTSLISMLIESAAFYSMVGVGYLIVTGVRSPVREPFMDAMISMQQISAYLIIARLAHGRGWQTDTASVPSKLVFLSHASTPDAQAGDEEEVSGNLKAAGGTAE
ncbi:hypothetical protein BD779DRAFT_291721 [Infundibulicybe gibba]|nr:hypothetical protein BD779DRAFT_291721 [Infundibulicybe gibba]